MTELEIITEAAGILKHRGDCRIEYITAEFSPVSDRFRPDLVFLPDAAPDRAFFVEYRTAASISRRSGSDLVASLVEHWEFVSADSPDITVTYGFASDLPLPNEVIAKLHALGIEFLGAATTGHELATHVIQWVQQRSHQLSY